LHLVYKFASQDACAVCASSSKVKQDCILFIDMSYAVEFHRCTPTSPLSFGEGAGGEV